MYSMATYIIRKVHVLCSYLFSRHLNIVIISTESKREATFFFLFILRLLQLLPLPLSTLAQTIELLQAFLEQLRVFLAKSFDE